MDFAAELDALMGKNRNSAAGTKVVQEHYSDSDVTIPFILKYKLTFP
jgi:hypothetical protein